MTTLQIKKFYEDASVPKKGHVCDAGWDLYSYENEVIPPMSWKCISTGVGVTVPIGTYGRVAPRSGVSNKGIW